MNKIQLASAGASLALVAGLTAQASTAAFSDVTDNPGNQFNAGSVTITDDDGGGTSMFSMSNMLPGSTATKCINVTYAGSQNAAVRLYGAATAGTGLEAYINVTIERSTGAAGGATFDCTGFNAASPVSVASGTSLGTFLGARTSYATGADSWAPAASSNETVSYRFTVTLQDDNNAQGKSATVAFTWEAQGV